MEIKTSSWTEQEQKVYDLITANKKRFILECAKQCQVHTLYTFHATTGWQAEIFIKYRKINPNWGDWVLCIGRVLHGMYIATSLINGVRDMGQIIGAMSAEAQLAFYERLAKRFYKVVHKRFLILKKRKADYLENTDTETIKELLARGFVYVTDVSDDWDLEDYEVIDLKYNLAWPKSFATITTAAAFLEKFGLPGCYYYEIKQRNAKDNH